MNLSSSAKIYKTNEVHILFTKQYNFKAQYFLPYFPLFGGKKREKPRGTWNGQPRIRHSIKSHPYKANSAFKTMPLGHTCMMYLPSLYVKFIIIIIDINYNFDTLGFSHLLFNLFYF